MSNDLHFRLAVSQLEQSGSVILPSQGYSMFPSIRPSDVCLFSPITRNQLSIGQILLFGEASGQLVGHRLIRIEETPSGTLYVCKGDTNVLPDEPIPFERIVGSLVRISRRNKQGTIKTVPTDTLRRVIWGTVLMKSPQLSRLLRGVLPFYQGTAANERNLL